MIWTTQFLFVVWFMFALFHPTDAKARVNPFTESIECRTLNPILGGGFKSSCSSRWQRRLGDKLIFDIDFSTDAFGRRITPNGVADNRKNNAIFFGCSFTLGAGVNGDQTTPYYFLQNTGATNVYNYGGSGFGPQQMLAILSQSNIKSQVNNVSGRTLGLYFFLDFHVQRAVGKPSVYNSFAKYFPYYYLDQNGQLVRDGTFTSGRPILSKFYSLVNEVPWLEGLFERLTEAPSESDIELTARIIEESRRKFLEDFRSDKFFVVFFPGSNNVINSRIKSYLDRSRVSYLDYSSLVEMSLPEAHLVDGHPTAWVHKQVGQHLVQDLELDLK